MYVAERITVEAGKMSGKPCIRGLRIRVTDVLHLLASGMPVVEILEDYPSLEVEDFNAALMFAAAQLDRPFATTHAIAAE